MSWLVAFYRAHGTKLLGSLAAVWGMITGYLGWLSSQPGIAFLLPPKWFAIFCIVSGTLGFFTLKRGFTNTRNLNDNP